MSAIVFHSWGRRADATGGSPRWRWWACVGTGAVLWLRPPWPTAARTIPTGAGFTVAVTQLPTEPQARTDCRSHRGRGYRPRSPAATARSYQVVAGPYVSLDEADTAQRFFAKRGFKARVLVDESVRRPRRT